MISLPWKTVLLLASAAALNYADRTSLSAVFPLLQAELALTDLQLAAIGTLFLWSYAFGSPFAGFFADRLPRNRVIVWSLLAWSLVTILTGFARTPNELLATRVLLGLAECFYLPAAVALIAGHHPSPSRGRALAVHLCGLNAGLVGGGALAGYLGENYGWRIGLFVLGALGILLSAICFALLKEAPRGHAPRPVPGPLGPQILELLRKRGYVLLSFQAMLISVGTWMFFNWMPLYFRESFGLSLAVAGFSGTAVLQQFFEGKGHGSRRSPRELGHQLPSGQAGFLLEHSLGFLIGLARQFLQHGFEHFAQLSAAQGLHEGMILGSAQFGEAGKIHEEGGVFRHYGHQWIGRPQRHKITQSKETEERKSEGTHRKLE